jgi:Spy/CpxP family protein refolding chaperone
MVPWWWSDQHPAPFLKEKNMNISKIIAWSGGLALALTATVLAAQGFGPMMGGGRGLGIGPMARFLNLTEAQQATSKAIAERHKASLDAKLRVANAARDEMRKAMDDPAVSDAKVKELHAKVSDAMSAVMLERRAMMLEMEAILTPDQKAAMAKQRSQGGPGMGRGMGKGPGGCGGGGCF